MICNRIQNCDWHVLFLSFAMNTTRVLSLKCFFVHFSTIDSFWLFLHRVSSHHYLNHCQNMDPMYSSSRSSELVREVTIKLFASLASQWIHFTSQWQVPKDPRDHACDRKQRRLHMALIFECTFHLLIAHVLLLLFSTVLPNITFLRKGFIVVQWETRTAWVL